MRSESNINFGDLVRVLILPGRTHHVKFYTDVGVVIAFVDDKIRVKYSEDHWIDVNPGQIDPFPWMGMEVSSFDHYNRKFSHGTLHLVGNSVQMYSNTVPPVGWKHVRWMDSSHALSMPHIFRVIPDHLYELHVRSERMGI